MKFIQKIRSWSRLFFHSIFHGMSGADKIIKGPAGSSDGVEIIQQQTGGGSVFADMLEEKKTQQVRETVDATYRIYKESDNWDTSSITITSEDENGVTFGGTNGLRKKVKSDFLNHAPVFNPDNLRIRTIQDNKQVQRKNNLIGGLNAVFEPEMLATGVTDYDVTITIERDGITPRFFLEKFAKKVVVREKNKRAYVDLYLPQDASQFGKIDAILISNLYKIYEENNLRSDLTDFISIEWFSDKGWNTEDVCLFKYDDIKFIGINKFDGSFVLTFDCNIVNDGTDLAEKYRTKELDEKYSTEAAKRDDIDIFTYSRHLEKKKENKEIDLDNLSNTTFKLS